MLTVTFRAARSLGPCSDRWAHARKALGPIRTVGETTPIPLLRVLDVCGLDDALWTLEAVKPAAERDMIARLFAADCAEWCLPWFEAERPNDDRPRKAIEAARAYALDPTPARAAARAAAWDDARAAARAAAWAAARAADAAWDDARAAARAAAWAAARAADAAWADAWDDAWAAANDRLRQYLVHGADAMYLPCGEFIPSATKEVARA